MQETKSRFIIKKYHSILRAAIIVEAVGFIVLLTDSIIAGNAIGDEAFAAIGLLTPFLSIATFLGAIVNTGTVLNFSYQVGKFNKRRANEFFSQGVITALTFISAPLIIMLFGVTEDALFHRAVSALRIVSCTLVFQAVLVLFFIYYVIIEKRLLAFVICLIKNFLSPVVFAEVLAVVLGSELGIWVGLADAPIFAFIISALIVYLKYDKEQFTFLITQDTEQQIFIYDFTVDTNTAVQMSQQTQAIMKQASFSPQNVVFAGLLTEEVLLLINDRNKNSKKPVNAECTLMVQLDGVRLIIRDSGVIFDITDTGTKVDFFRQFVVSNLMVSHESKLYMVTTGYNRNEFFFSRENA